MVSKKALANTAACGVKTYTVNAFDNQLTVEADTGTSLSVVHRAVIPVIKEQLKQKAVKTFSKITDQPVPSNANDFELSSDFAYTLKNPTSFTTITDTYGVLSPIPVPQEKSSKLNLVRQCISSYVKDPNIILLVKGHDVQSVYDPHSADPYAKVVSIPKTIEKVSLSYLNLYRPFGDNFYDYCAEKKKKDPTLDPHIPARILIDNNIPLDGHYNGEVIMGVKTYILENKKVQTHKTYIANGYRDKHDFILIYMNDYATLVQQGLLGGTPQCVLIDPGKAIGLLWPTHLVNLVDASYISDNKLKMISGYYIVDVSKVPFFRIIAACLKKYIAFRLYEYFGPDDVDAAYQELIGKTMAGTRGNNLASTTMTTMLKVYKSVRIHLESCVYAIPQKSPDRIMSKMDPEYYPIVSKNIVRWVEDEVDDGPPDSKLIKELPPGGEGIPGVDQDDDFDDDLEVGDIEGFSADIYQASSESN